MNKVNAIQQAVSEYESTVSEMYKKQEALIEELKPKVNYRAERDVKGRNDITKLVVTFGVNPPLEHEPYLCVDVLRSSGCNAHLISTPNEGKALYEILKELYE